ncbi:hypothetical protein L2449_32500, partial [Mesorhizobium muleiense]
VTEAIDEVLSLVAGYTCSHRQRFRCLNNRLTSGALALLLSALGLRGSWYIGARYCRWTSAKRAVFVLDLEGRLIPMALVQTVRLAFSFPDLICATPNAFVFVV